MPSIAKRGQSTPLSPFRKLSPVADRAKASGKKVYHLNIGQPDILTPQPALQRLRETPLEILAYSAAEGNLSYRAKLATYYERFGIALAPEEVVVTTGGSEGILFFMLACLDPGDEIIIPEPFYANYNGFAHMAGVVVRPISTVIETGFALPPADAFREAIGPRTRAIFITNPNNPTGCCYDRAALEELGAIVKEHDLYLCVDEVYREFCYDGHNFYSALLLPGLEDNVVVIDSISKRYSACGARIGALLTRNTDVREAVLRFSRLRLSPPGLGQLLGEYLIDDDAAYLDAVKAEYDRRRHTVFRRLQAMPGVDSYLPGGAFYCFARFPIHSAEDFCLWLLESFSHEGATVMLSPGEGFYATPGRGVDEVRIAYVLREEDLEAAMDCLEAALEAYPGRKAAELLFSGAARV